jgi:serine/threonine-protein kinase
MTDDPRVQQLLDQLLDSQATPELVCATCPELLPVVRTRWQQMRRVRADLDALFPPPDDTAPHPAEGVVLPLIPGYEVEEVLGRGGMGIVFRARHLPLNRLVALKMALAGAFAEPLERLRFQREAEAVARLHHPNVVQIYDIGEADGRPYFTMQLVDGGSLAQKLAGTPQPAREAAQLVATLAGAVQAAHATGIIHRDLKPSNVLLAADGTPKISDFGVARRVEEGAGLTQTGVPVGTPSYMAPEQARGRRDAAGPAADVYALGAILYELLTGRPPFRGETASATMHLVLTEEPLPPARLNPRAPRDLETICLKGLQKDPAKRYPTASELAADLERFLKHEPIQARPPGRLERCLRWVRRRPAEAGLLAAVALVVAAGAVGAWLVYQLRAAAHARQIQTDQRVRAVVDRARGLLENGWQAADPAKLNEARAEGNRAVDIARSGDASAAVRQEAEAFQEEADRRLVRAEKNRALLAAVLDVSAPQETSAYTQDSAGRLLVLAQPSADEQYAAAFRNWGLDLDGTAEAEVVERLRRDPDVVVQELIAGVDAWMMERRRQKRPEAEWRRLVRVADRLDSSDQHRRLRALLVGDAPPRAEAVAGLVGVGSPWLALWELARGNAWRRLLEVRKEIDPRMEPVPTAVLLARACVETGDTAGAEEVLRQAAAARPDQVALLMALGKLLERQRPEEAIGYYRAARGQRPSLGIGLSNALVRAGRATQGEEILQELALRQPDNPAIYFALGVNLSGQQKHAKAEAAYRKAVALQPDFAGAHSNLGAALNEQRKHGEAEVASRKAIALRPDFAEAHINLGGALHGQGRPGAAEAAYRKAIALKPDFALAYTNLGGALNDQRRHDEAEEVSRRAIALKPDFAEALTNLGNALSGQGKSGAAEAAYRKAITLKPELAEAPYNLGRILSGQGRLVEAEAAYRKALELKPAYPEALTNLGNALSRQRKLGAAEAAFRKALELKPELAEAHYNLGLALMQRAQFQEAAASLKKAGELFPEGDRGREQVRQLRQQCQRFVILDARLPMILKGTEKPANAAEQLEIARLCYLKKLYASAARLYAEAFAMSPQFAEGPRPGYRYSAACSAALAGCGRGEDSAEAGDAERARWRAQARQWLRADLDAWAKKLDSGLAADRAQVHKILARWREDPDLAGLRDPDALEKLSPAERQECRALWGDHDALLCRARPSP